MNKDIENRIKELEEIINNYEKQLKFNDDKLKQAQLEHEENRKFISEAMAPIKKEHDDLVIDLWIERGKNGLNKGLNTWKNKDTIPKEVKYQFAKLLREEENGCIGDVYDGCRGCSRNCYATALEKYNKIFGF